MKYILSLFALAMLFMTACSSTPRTAAPVANVQAGEVYLKASEINPADRSAPVWIALRNTGTATAVIIKAESAWVKSVELRNGDKPVATVEIPAGVTLDMTPTTNHVHLIGIPDAVKVGDTFGIALDYASSLQMPLTVTVRP